MGNNWADDIRNRFPDWQTDHAASRWPEAKSRLSVGQEVSGTVVARAPFGVWIDIGVGHPALLLVPEMAGADKHRITFDEYPALGAIVKACVLSLPDKPEIGLTQFPGGRYWATHPSQNLPPS